MINPEDEIVVDMRASCTQEEAVIKLLGWSRGPFLRKYVHITESGFPQADLPFIHASHLSLAEQLVENREVARSALIDAAEADSSDDILAERENAVQVCDDLIRKAHEYRLDIADELAKDAESKLRVDRSIIPGDNGPHITLRSLDSWAREKYGVSLLGAEGGRENKVPEVLQSGLSGDPLGEGDHGYKVTLAFMVEFAASKAPNKYIRSGGDVNVSLMTDDVSKMIDEKIGQRVRPRGQGKESIRKRIAEALNIKKKTWG